MALICMATYATEENKKAEIALSVIDNIIKTTDLTKHRLVIIDNNSCDEMKHILSLYLKPKVEVIYNKENVGTAAAINQGLKLRIPGENCIKMDDDVIINHIGWVDEMEAAIAREPLIGIIGLKRKDLAQSPNRTDWAKSRLVMLPHEAGESWIVIEVCPDIMGTCTMFNSALLDKVGYMYQLNKYGFDDNFMAHRSNAAGFMNCFLPHINIDHIDKGDTPYQEWKHKESRDVWNQSVLMFNKIRSGEIGYYFDPEIAPTLIFNPKLI